MLKFEQNPVLKPTSAATGKCPKFPVHYKLAIRSQIIFQFHFAFSLLPPTNDHGLAVNLFRPTR